MDHDRLFKELLTVFFVEFIDLFLPDVAAYLDKDSIEFLDKEVFTDVTAGSKHEVDLLVKARLRNRDTFSSSTWRTSPDRRRISTNACSVTLLDCMRSMICPSIRWRSSPTINPGDRNQTSIRSPSPALQSTSSGTESSNSTA